jgi:cysteinyl-tRNA synthetase
VGDPSSVPEQVRRLAEDRQRSREAKDFGAADAIRELIRRAGYEVTDTPQGPVLSRIETPRVIPATGAVRPEDVRPLIDRPPDHDISIQWVVEGWPEDVVRGIASFDRRHPDARRRHVVVDVAGVDPGVWPDDVDVVRLHPGTGWAAARNVGLLRASGRIVVAVDGCVECTGDVLTPLRAALEDPAVGLTGPFGIVTDDLRDFHGSPGPEVDAVEGYLMAFHRSLVEDGLRFDEKFRFYRTADIELSFQVKDRGLRVTVTDIPVRRHEHRMWANTPEDRRAALSKRNFYRFLGRWRGREDLLVASRR